MRVYVAGRYSRRLELAEEAAAIEARGYRVTSRWLLGNHQAENDELHRGTAAERFGWEDLADVEEADVLVAFTEPPRASASRGGRHVEFGYALGRSMPILIVGPRENVFSCLVDQVDSVGEALEWLDREAARSPAMLRSIDYLAPRMRTATLEEWRSAIGG